MSKLSWDCLSIPRPPRGPILVHNQPPRPPVPGRHRAPFPRPQRSAAGCGHCPWRGSGSGSGPPWLGVSLPGHLPGQDRLEGSGGPESVCSVPPSQGPVAADGRGPPGWSCPPHHCRLRACRGCSRGNTPPFGPGSSHHRPRPSRRCADCLPPPPNSGGREPRRRHRGYQWYDPRRGRLRGVLAAQTPPHPRLPTARGASPNDFGTEGDARIKGFATRTRNRSLKYFAALNIHLEVFIFPPNFFSFLFFFFFLFPLSLSFWLFFSLYIFFF